MRLYLLIKLSPYLQLKSALPIKYLPKAKSKLMSIIMEKPDYQSYQYLAFVLFYPHQHYGMNMMAFLEKRILIAWQELKEELITLKDFRLRLI